MMDAFFGNWKLVNSENFDEFLKATGHDQEVVQIGNIVIPVVSIFQEGDKVVMRTKTSISKTEVSFVLGEEFEEVAYGNLCKSVVHLDGDKLVHVKKWECKSCTITGNIKGDQLVLTLECGSAVALRTFERTSEVT